MINDIDFLQDISFDKIDIPKDIFTMIDTAKSIAVIGHLEPDGDALNSQLALTVAFNENGWDAQAINVGPFDNRLARNNKKYFVKDISKEYDLYIIVDTPSKKRIGKIHSQIDYEKSIVIDHHFTNDNFGKSNWIDASFLSTAEMVMLLLHRIGIGLDNQEICQYLLDGIISDSGFFSHIKKKQHFSLLASYYLIEKGADPRISYLMMYGGRELAGKKIMGILLDRIKSIEKGKILWTYIFDKDKKQFGNNKHIDSSDIFKEMMSVVNVEVAIIFKVNKDKIDISFRSSGKIDVASLAQTMGGGGHKAAAGLSLTGNYEEIRKEVLRKSIDFLNKVLYQG